jgi:hypothetical protein
MSQDPAVIEEPPAESYALSTAEKLDTILRELQADPEKAVDLQTAATTFALFALGHAGVRVLICAATEVRGPVDAAEGEVLQHFIPQFHSNQPYATPHDKEVCDMLEVMFAEKILAKHGKKIAAAE